MDYPGGHNIITSVLESERGRQKKRLRGRHGYRRKIREMQLSGEKRSRPQAKECMQTLEAGKENRFFHPASRKECGPADTLILVQ